MYVFVFTVADGTKTVIENGKLHTLEEVQQKVALWGGMKDLFSVWEVVPVEHKVSKKSKTIEVDEFELSVKG